MKEILNKNEAITLVSLIVTIIVLIILAGVSINLILGDNGIVTIAKRAKENTELAKVREETELNELYTQLETENPNSGNPSYNAITPFIDYEADNIAEIVTYNGSWTATQDCACIAQIGAVQGISATVYVNGNVALATSVVTSANSTYTYVGIIYVKKGQIVTTRNVSGQKYNLIFKPLIK